MADGWSDEELSASVDAYRKMADNDSKGQPYSKRQVYKELADQFGRSAKAFEYRMQNISAVLDELGMPWIPGLKPAVNVGAAMSQRLISIIKGQADTAPSGQFKHGDKRTWELALDAVAALGGTVGPQEVLAWIVERHPDYNEKNLVDLAMLSVNSPSRTAYGTNVKPRRTDQGSEYDRLFKVGSGSGVVFELYDPTQHGVWEIYPDKSSGNKSGMSVRQAVNPVDKELSTALTEAEGARAFDAQNVEDSRKRVLAGIVRRQGQPAFRKALLEAYGGMCAITGCKLTAVLEAAHIHPYKGEHTNLVSNGLLLRTDIHTLFDLRLMAVDPETLTVLLSPELDGSEYEHLRGLVVGPASDGWQEISRDALGWHRSRCGW